MLRRHFFQAAVAALTSLCALASVPVAAQAYPDQSIKWIVPYPAGGGTDVLARTLAESMRPGLGQQVVVDNRPGAANLPANVTARLNRELVKALADPEVLKRFGDFAFEPIRVSPEEFRKMARDESARWGAVIKANNISLD